MNRTSLRLDNAFTKNRTEELDLDVWEHFVVPPFYDRLDLKEAMKPRVLIGGRGTGKTMLLRYLSHYSMFSPKRPIIPNEDVSHIGLYLRADTQFAKVMSGRGLENDVWESAFEHLLCLLLGAETIRSLTSIANSKSSALTLQDLDQCSFDELKVFDSAFTIGTTDLLKTLELRRYEFEMWVSNVRKRPEPQFLPGRTFLLALIKCIKAHWPALATATYRVYLDEYENLALYQQKIINTYLKHSEAPLIFNLAMKRNAFTTRETGGNESITEISDFRQYDLEESVLAMDFNAFAAEILFATLALAGVAQVPVQLATLRDPTALDERRETSYREKILSAARHILPGLSHEELAREAFAVRPVSRKLKEEIQRALTERGSQLPVDLFYRTDQPMATIITPALLRRKSLQAEEIAAEMEALVKGEDNRFTGKTDWIHNNFIGCLLQLYEPHSRIAPFYAGFETFCLLARGNIRHFLELCHKSLNEASPVQPSESLSVQPQIQAAAARQASAAFLGEVRSFGNHGNQLYTFVLRLGSLFAIAHRRPTQSEPEVNHFSIARGDAVLSDIDISFLSEAVKWSVLYEEKETKVKNEYQPAQNEYILNPIYSPYFHISYRKIRRLDLSTDDLIVLIRGSYNDVRSLLRRASTEWAVDLEGADPTLFAHLAQES